MDNRVLWPGWETVRLIGRGSFGAVYEIERDMLGEKEKAALKVISIPESSSEIDSLRDEGYDDASITDTFKEHLKGIVAEYALMRKLNGNTNVVSCDDVRYVQHDDGFGWDIFIKMELLTPMKKALGRTVSDEQTVRVGMDLSRALTLCRSYSIIHRDIKPDNIFVSDTGDFKLGDFGVAKVMEKTSGGTKIGTYEYMAPEVYRGQPYGASADIYSLGMVLYWLLNERRAPFLPLPPALPTVAEKEQARLRRFAGESIPAPAHGSEELRRIVLKAVAYDPKDRYQSAEEMLRDLEALVRAQRISPATAETAASVTPAAPAVPVGAPRQEKKPPQPAMRPTAPLPKAPAEEDGTVGVWSRPAPAKAGVPGGARARQTPFDATVGVFGTDEMTVLTPQYGRQKQKSARSSPEQPDSLKDLAFEWYCECGYKNTSGTYCKSCFRPAPERVFRKQKRVAEKEKTADNLWTCSCGFRNNSWRTVCASCFKPRNEVDKV